MNNYNKITDGEIPDLIFPPSVETSKNLEIFLNNIILLQNQYHRVCRSHTEFALKEYKGFKDVRYCAFCGKLYALYDGRELDIDPAEYIKYRKEILSGLFE